MPERRGPVPGPSGVARVGPGRVPDRSGAARGRSGAARGRSGAASPRQELVERVVAGLRARGATLAVAESLTGGALTAALVTVPGASEVLRGGVVPYASDLKHELLGVDRGLLAAEGAVHPWWGWGSRRRPVPVRPPTRREWPVTSRASCGGLPAGRAALAPGRPPRPRSRGLLRRRAAAGPDGYARWAEHLAPYLTG
ncbi:CinA family protein [Georgenia sp. SUBG003]|uniref:CinA family protein n=1 Tax=Georgenia sp. SUBG003 TaxID=1497974 RepID=UPI003AB65F90